MAAKKKESYPDKQRTFSAKAEDVKPLTQVLFFFIQSGYTTVDVIIDQMKRIGAHSTATAIGKTLDVMKTNGLLTSGVHQQEDGNPAEQYKVESTRVSFTGQEMKHILYLEKELAESDAGKKLAQVVGGTGVREVKDVYRFWILVRNTEPFFGGYPLKSGNPGMQLWYKNSPYKCESLKPDQDPAPLLFWREQQGGALKIHKAIVRNWLAELVQVSNKAAAHETMRNHISAKHIFIGPKQEMTSTTLPVPGVGMATYETLPAGEVFQIVVDVPTSKVALPLWVELLVEQDGVSKNSLSPGRGSQTGDVEILSIDVQPKEFVEGKRSVRRLYTAPSEVQAGEISPYMRGEPIDPYVVTDQERPDDAPRIFETGNGHTKKGNGKGSNGAKAKTTSPKGKDVWAGENTL